MDEIMYFVVRNSEGQYSIWANDRAIPAGWDVEGIAAPKAFCLEYIRTHWVDMTPISLRTSSMRTAVSPA
jgi:MbtH protein